MRDWLFRGAGVVVFILLGFFQEWIKVNINWFIDHLAYIPNYDALLPADRLVELSKMRYEAPYDYYYSHSTLNDLTEFSTRELTMLKYGVGLFLVIIYYVLNHFAIKRMLKKESLLVFLTYIYIGIGALVAVFFSLYFFWKHEMAIYNVGRELLGLLQSPLPVVLIYLPAMLFYKNDKLTS